MRRNLQELAISGFPVQRYAPLNENLKVITDSTQTSEVEEYE